MKRNMGMVHMDMAFYDQWVAQATPEQLKAMQKQQERDSGFRQFVCPCCDAMITIDGDVITADPAQRDLF